MQTLAVVSEYIKQFVAKFPGIRMVLRQWFGLIWNVDLNAILKYTKPSLTSTAESGDEGTPVDGEIKPIDDEGTPVDDEGTPVDGEGTPVDGEIKPIDDEGTPVDGEVKPIDDEGISIDDEMKNLSPISSAISSDTSYCSSDLSSLSSDASNINTVTSLQMKSANKNKAKSCKYNKKLRKMNNEIANLKEKNKEMIAKCATNSKTIANLENDKKKANDQTTTLKKILRDETKKAAAVKADLDAAELEIATLKEKNFTLKEQNDTMTKNWELVFRTLIEVESPPTDSIGKLVWKLLKRDAPAYKRFRKGADLVAFCEDIMQISMHQKQD